MRGERVGLRREESLLGLNSTAWHLRIGATVIVIGLFVVPVALVAVFARAGTRVALRLAQALE